MINLNKNQALLLVIDIQDRLAASMPKDGFSEMFKNTKILIQGCATLQVPIIQSMQYKKGLGESVAGLFESSSESGAQSFESSESRVQKIDFEKRVFSCCYENSEFLEFLAAHKNIKQIIIAGMEAHVCVLQTARDLLESGFEVVIAQDCVLSRKDSNKENALAHIQNGGGNVLNTESILFDLLKTSMASEFKTISNLVK